MNAPVLSLALTLSEARVLLDEREEALENAMHPKAFWDEHRKRGCIEIDCGCISERVKDCDAGGVFEYRRWVSCPLHEECEAVLKEKAHG